MDRVKGIWTCRTKSFIEYWIPSLISEDLEFSEIEKTIREVSTKPCGLSRIQEKKFNAFALFYRMGFIYTETDRLEKNETNYIVASPIHQWYVKL